MGKEIFMATKKKALDVQDAGLDAQALHREALLEAFRGAVAVYKKPTDPLVLEKLEWFQDQKLGLMVHFGLYNMMGIKESWPLVDHMSWTKWQFKPGTKHAEVKAMYDQLHRGFLPLRFDPDDWADIAYAAGFRYLCFTAKHHDGFCMWDTSTSDYKVTGSEVPWRTNKNADITRALFDAFRLRGMGISLYYSRADFSCPYYWEEGYAEKEGTQRFPSYDSDEKPEKWRKFQEYVFTQLKELVEGYGKIDCLWYDGGCDGIKLGIPEMTEKLRKIQPGMIGVLRSPHGALEDVVTPELVIPQEYVPVPWEACMVMGKNQIEYGVAHTSFGYTFDQDYMSAKEVAHLLLDVIAKGGNLALNISPQPDGRLPVRAVGELKILATWMDVFAPAIYGTRAVAPYRYGSYAYTRSKDEKRVNVFYLYKDKEKRKPVYTFKIDGEAQRVTDLRSGEALRFEQIGGKVKVYLPDALVGTIGDIADCFIVDKK